MLLLQKRIWRGLWGSSVCRAVLHSRAGARRSPLGALQGVALLSVPFDLPPFLRFSHGSSLECE